LQTRQFFDTRADILDNQFKEVVHNTDEMKGSLKESVDDLKSITAYVSLFKEAYSEEKEPINPFNIANAISSYIRSLIAVRSSFDEYMLGDKTKLTSFEKMALIFLPVKPNVPPVILFLC
jgi:cytochrome c peroxidase